MSSDKFLKQVMSYIRSKEARAYVHEELKQHMEHSKWAWQKKGYSAEDAEQKAIEEMGSPSQIGKSMDKIHRPKWDFWLIGCIVCLVAVSFIPILTFDSAIQFGANMTSNFIINKIVHILVAVIVIAILIYVDYRKFQRFSIYFYGFALILLMMMKFSPNALANGEAMLHIGPIHIKVWTVLPILLVAFAGFFAERKYTSWQLIILFIIPLFLIVNIPNLVVALMYVLVIAVLFSFSYFSRKVKRNLFLATGIMLFAIIGYLVFNANKLFASYQTARILAFLNPEQYATTGGYMYIQLKKALKQSGWFGAETISYVPEGHTDFAFVQLIQAYGYAAGIGVGVLLLFVALRLLWILRKIPNSFGKLLVVAAMTLYSFQSIYSVFMIVGLLPLAGVPLPFISYGITPLLLNAVLIGLVLSVYRRKSYIGKIKTIKASI